MSGIVKAHSVEPESGALPYQQIVYNWSTGPEGTIEDLPPFDEDKIVAVGKILRATFALDQGIDPLAQPGSTYDVRIFDEYRVEILNGCGLALPMAAGQVTKAPNIHGSPNDAEAQPMHVSSALRLDIIKVGANVSGRIVLMMLKL